MDYNDLVQRLRAAAATSEVDPDECADAITALQATLNDHLASESAETMRADKDKAEIRSLRTALDRLIAQIADMQKLRLEDELIHGNVMGRIAIALFGDQNNRTDEECVARAAEIGYELASAQENVKDYKENSALFLRQRDEARTDLAAARALLREIREQGYRKEMTARIDAALAGERKP